MVRELWSTQLLFPLYPFFPLWPPLLVQNISIVEYADNTKASLCCTIPAKLLLSSEALYYQKYKKIPRAEI
jgi:hypothetical protein